MARYKKKQRQELGPQGMRFFIEVNEREHNPLTGEVGSQTMHVVHGTHCAKTNKKRLFKYLEAVGVPAKDHKRTLKALGFWGEALGN